MKAKIMTAISGASRAAGVVLCFAALACNVFAADGDDRALAGARRAVELSQLADGDKALVLDSLDRAAVAGVPGEDTALIASRLLEQNAQGTVIAQYLTIAADLRGQGLPVRLVLDRIEQGLAKGVPHDRIAAVAQKLSKHITQAGAALQNPENRDLASDRTIESVARAYEKFFPAETIELTERKVREKNGGPALFGCAVDTMTSFAGGGMSVPDASRLVHTALDRGYSERDFEAMERYMVSELRKNRPISEVVSAMGAHVERNGPRGGPGRQGGTLRGPAGGPGNGPGHGGRR